MNMTSRKRSEIWNHFSKEKNNKAKCNYCSTLLLYAGGSTGNICA